MSKLPTVVQERTPDGFHLHRAGRTATMVRVGYEPYLQILSGAAVPAESELIGGGRVRHPLARVGEERALIREYRRGGLVRHFNTRRYFGGHRSFDEMAVTEAARTRGVNVPFVLAATERREAVGYTAWIATRWIEGASGAIDWLGDESARRLEAGRLIGEQIGRMHRAGVIHPDLNLNNVLITGACQSAILIDFDRARLQEGEAPVRERIRNIERLARSARKLDIELGPDLWRAIRGGYGADWPLRDRLP